MILYIPLPRVVQFITFSIMRFMKEKSLTRKNRYLQNKDLAQKLLVRNIATSTTIETGEPIKQIEAKLKRFLSAEKRKTLS